MMTGKPIDGVLPDNTHSCRQLQPYWPASLQGMPITGRTEPALDNLFNALDGRAVVVGDRTWRLHLYSVRELDKTVWIQLDVVGTPTYVLTLCQPLTTDSTEVLATVSRYLELTKDATDSVVFDRILGSALMSVTVQGAAQLAAE